MSVVRRIVQLLVVAGTATEEVVPLLLGQPREPLDVVRPALHGHEARAVGGDRCFDGSLVRRVLGSVHVARQIPPVPVLEQFHVVGNLVGVAQHAARATHAVVHSPAIGAAHEQPHRTLGGRHVDPRTRKRGERAQAGNLGAEGGDQRSTQTEHGHRGLDSSGERRQTGAWIACRAQGESDGARRRGNGRKHEGLGRCHRRGL